MVEITKPFEFGYAKLNLKYSQQQIDIVDKVLKMITNHQLKTGDYKDHPLGKSKLGYRDCHPLFENDPKIDLVILYKIEKHRITFCNIGTHREIFA
ncbi:hypothetical protein FACS1894166_10920 [Bacilli bacterium]|nr:hypothetical protein FACS1894166_10920 [Bacilli bacterium]